MQNVCSTNQCVELQTKNGSKGKIKKELTKNELKNKGLQGIKK
jgi:hypothetical protein